MIYPQQQAYKDAKVKYDELTSISGEQQNDILATWAGDLEGEDLERYAELATEIEFEIGLPQATTALRKAEDELLAWGLEYCRKESDYMPVIGILEQLQMYPLLDYRRKACDTLLKLGTFDKVA